MKKQILTAVAVIAATSIAQERTVNTSLWFDGSNEQVNTGADCMYDSKTCDDSKMGYWFSYDDRMYDNGGSYALYPFKPPVYYSSSFPEVRNLGYVTIKYVLADPTTTGQTAQHPYNFVGIGFNIKDSETPFNISATGGLCATYTADHDVTLEVSEETSGDNSCFVTLKKSASPKTENFAIADFKQPSYTKTNNPERVIECSQAFSAAKAVKFKIDGAADMFSGKLRIFEVGPYGTCTGKGSISINEPISYLYKSNGNGGFTKISPWFDGSNEQVNTGADCIYKKGQCVSTTMGYWYDRDDRKSDNGDSYAEYPYVPDKYGSTITPEIDKLGYVTIKYNLKEPVRQTVDYPYNFVDFGFNLKDAKKTPIDITGTDGLCATYTADHPVTLQIIEKTSGNASCAVTLNSASTPTMVNASIDDFTQPDWAGTPGHEKDAALSSCYEAFSKAQSIMFRMDGDASAISGQLRIFEVGPYGTCAGAGLIYPYEPTIFACKSDGDGNKNGCESSTYYSSSSSNTIRSSSSSNIVKSSSSTGIIIPTYSSSSAINYREACGAIAKKDTTYFVCEGTTISKVYTGSTTTQCQENSNVICAIEKIKSGYEVICNNKTIGTIKNSSENSKVTCVDSDASFTCKIKDLSTDGVKANKPAMDKLVSISVNGRKVTLDGFGDFAYYQLLDMQGNVVDSGYSSGAINFASVKSGNYILKVKGDITLTKQIVLK